MGQFFHELNRRNVVRVGIAYLVAAWLVIQVVETIFPAFGFGDAAIRTVVIVLAIGFPLVLILSWVYELTPEGLKLERDVDRSRSIVHQTSKRLDRAIIAVLTLAIGYFAVDKFVLDPARDAERAKVVATHARSEALVESFGDNSIAVMPFVNMSDDPGNEYFSDGISEELLNLLSRFPELRVISRSSSFSFKGKDVAIPAVAEQLNVAHVLEGSVRKAGNRVRVTAQLIDARSDTHLWSESYDRELDDVFVIQDEISAAIVGALETTMGLQVAATPTATAQRNVDAHEAYLRGRYLIAQRTPDAVKAAIREFEKAVALDPNYALAHAELSLATRRLSFSGELTPAEARARAAPHAERAMALDPTLAQAHAATGYVWVTPETIEKAISHFRRAIQLNPNYSDAHLWLGNFVGGLGDYDEAFSMHEKAARLDPLSRPAITNYAIALIARNRLAEADQQLEKLASIDPGYYAASGLRSYRASIGGKWAHGLLAALESLLINPEPTGDFPLAKAFAAVGLEKEALALSEIPPPDVLSILGKPTDELANAQTRLAESPNSFGTRFALGLALAGTGDYANARPILEELLQMAAGRVTTNWFTAEWALALIAARRHEGDKAGAAELVEAIRDNVRRYHEAGITVGNIFSSVNFENGVAGYLGGDRDRGLALIAKATEEGYFIRPNEAYLQWLYDDADFAPILERQKARQIREREQVLAVVCADNPYAAVWKPADETCKQFAASSEN